jgi:uncharacterized protein (DUF3820 family)
MALPSQSNPAIVSFGKHRGASWKDVPTDYLRWAEKEAIHGNQPGANLLNSLHHIQDELKKRGHPVKDWAFTKQAQAVPPPPQMLGEEPYDPDNYPIKVKTEAVDSASLYLMRSFLLRVDKSQGFVTWLKGLAESIIHTNEATVRAQVDCHTYPILGDKNEFLQLRVQPYRKGALLLDIVPEESLKNTNDPLGD